jgi:hypothetical protein
MPSRAPLLGLALALALSACDEGKQPATPAKADAKAGSGPTDAKAADTKAHDTKDPHAGMGANPHAGMPPMMGAAPPKGPPRDVTPSGEVADSDLRGLAVKAPKEWESQPPKSSMRVAQWVIPGPGGDGELVVTRFPGGGGGIEANVERWKTQFQPPEGKTIDDVTQVKTIEGKGGLKTTLVDVTGRFVAAVVPGADEKHDEADYRMLAAIVEGFGDPFYFKLVGPQKTVDLWAAPFETMIGTFEAKDAGAAAPDTKADDAKADDKKADDKKADDKKADDKKPGDKKADDKKADDKKADDKKPADKKADDKKAG